MLEKVINHIDEMNNCFDNSVIDSTGKIDTVKLFPSLITFFDNIDKIRNGSDFIKIMREFYLA